jgi:tetratricopeptide (TPR) repeat protein
VDSIRDLLQRLRETQGDTLAQAALTAEFLVVSRPDEERGPLRAALDAAAVLHWFDAELLGKVLAIPDGDARIWCQTLKEHSFAEPYRGETDRHYNLHESTRLGWRIRFARERPDRFRALSLRTSSCFADNLTPSGRIEWIYHLLCGDPDIGVSELENLDREWSGSARPEHRSALAVALQELVVTDLVKGKARAWSLLTIGWTRDTRGETAQLAEIAAETLRLACESGDKSAEADARCLVGDVLWARGELEPAQKAYDEFLSLRRHSAEQDPSNASWQRELAHSRVGDVLQAMGRLEAAHAAFDQYLAISRRLAEQGPSNAGRQRDLAVAHSRIGGVSQALGRLEAAQAAFEQDLAISRRLAEQDPSNAGWQRDLAVTHGRIGDVLQAQGRLEAAHAAFDQDLAISRRLAEQDPSNAGWQRDLAVAYRRVGDVLQAQGRLEAAQAAFDQYLAISRRLAEQDPSNAGWQLELAVAYSRVGDVSQARGRLEAAQAAFDQDLAIFRRLAEQDPSNAGWQRDLAVAYRRVGDVLQAQGRLEAAQAAFDRYLAISRRLAEQDPSNADWQRDLAVAFLRIGRIAVAANLKDIGLPLYEESLRILAALVQRAPGFVRWAEDMKIVEAELTALRATIASSPDGAADGVRHRKRQGRGDPCHGVADRLHSQPIQPASLTSSMRRRRCSRPVSPAPENNRGQTP